AWFPLQVQVHDRLPVVAEAGDDEVVLGRDVPDDVRQGGEVVPDLLLRCPVHGGAPRGGETNGSVVPSHGRRFRARLRWRLGHVGRSGPRAGGARSAAANVLDALADGVEVVVVGEGVLDGRVEVDGVVGVRRQAGPAGAF